MQTRGIGGQQPIVCSGGMGNAAKKGAATESRPHKGAEKRASWFLSRMCRMNWALLLFFAEKVLTHQCDTV